MLNFFTICFWTGVIFSVVSFIIGTVLGEMHFNGNVEHGDLPFHPSGNADSTNFHIGENLHPLTVSPLKPIVITTMVTTFGGVGMIALKYKLVPFLATLLAFIVGLIVAYIIYRFIVVPLYKAQNTTAISQQSLVGNRAKATLVMKDDCFGSISYVVNNINLTAPAKSDEGVEIAKGEEVMICRIEDSVFYVKKPID